MPTLNVKLTSNGQNLPFDTNVRGRIRVGFVQQDIDSASFQHFTDEQGAVAIELLPKGTYHVWPLAEGYTGSQVDVVLIDGENPQVEIPLVQAGKLLTRVAQDGTLLHNYDGRWFGKGTTDFLLYKRFLDGEDISPILNQRASLGVNVIRVFGMVSSFSHWYPQEYGDRFYDSLPVFCKLCENYGIYVYFCVFADTRIVMPDRGQQENHWNRTVDALKRAENTIVEFGNEINEHDNNPDFDPSRPDGILACRGSYGGQPEANPPMHTTDWSLGDFHARRDYPKAIVDMPVIQLRTGDTTDGRAHNIPIWQGEPVGFGSDGRRWQDPQRARELSGTASGTACGVFFHSDQGIVSTLFDGITLVCAQAFFDEIKGK